MRKKDKLFDLHPLMRVQPRDKTQRVQEAINSQSRVEFVPLDSKKLHFPKFREEDVRKWMTKTGFSMAGYKHTGEA